MPSHTDHPRLRGVSANAEMLAPNGDLTNVRHLTYNRTVKYKDVARELLNAGWWLKSDNGPHEKWTNGRDVMPVPRHKEINEYTARGIIKKAKNNPGPIR
jgi:mRNA interferase HicA